MKQCSRCNATKSPIEFSKHSKTLDGLQPWCKECCSAHRKIRLAEPEYKAKRNNEIREYHRGNLTSRLRNSMRHLIRRICPGKVLPSRQVLGYSVNEFCRHIESQFQPGMSWSNRSAWHVDHIKSVSTFIAEGVTDPKVINALSNLRPLWARDNLAKGAK